MLVYCYVDVYEGRAAGAAHRQAEDLLQVVCAEGEGGVGDGEEENFEKGAELEAEEGGAVGEAGDGFGFLVVLVLGEEMKMVW